MLMLIFSTVTVAKNHLKMSTNGAGITGGGFQGSSYANERPPSSTGSGDAVDVANDPASSSFFANDYKKHEDLTEMLDSSKDSQKLEAMKRIIGIVAKGKDASNLFPAVVKNVVSKNIEVKKLVYVYLVRYAEEQQDLALLSISTFQRALKDPNQLIRASALRVLSSIRVPMIVPIMMLAIKEAVMDMSPYVRKTAAHAIPKLYNLDAEQKEMLIELMEKLLGDKTTLVAGSAIQAFEEVCPERIDLIHRNYRKLCSLLVDVEEWGQVIIIGMLTRYCRTQFCNPNDEDGTDEADRPFYASSSDSEETEGGGGESREVQKKKAATIMDSDHRMLLRTCKPLLNSRNAAVVMAVGQLYHHCAPNSEVALVAKALVRLLRGYKEVQYVVLTNIASMSISRKGLFEPYLKSFYVRSNDPTHVKLLKLEIMTSLGTETNISTILREFQTYVTSADKQFAAATIQAIGRCAMTISEITDACLNGLVYLLSNRNEAVVGESVIVIKKLLQMQPSEHNEIIVHLAKLVDNITVPMARASILWLIGEYSDRIPRTAPDVLRRMAKGFIEEKDIVKLQILTLATKLCILNPKQTQLLCQYVFNLARYDQNYDIRDRARFLRHLILAPADMDGGDTAGEKPVLALAKHTKKIFLALKPVPVTSSRFEGQQTYQLGTLSHVMNIRACGYRELSAWPHTAPDPAERNVEMVPPESSWLERGSGGGGKKGEEGKKKKAKAFYSESEEEESSSEGETSSEDGSSSEGTTSEESSSGDEEVESAGQEASSSEQEEEDRSSSAEESDSEDSSSAWDTQVRQKVSAPKPVSKPPDMLLDLDFEPTSNTTPTMGLAAMLTPTAANSGTPQVKVQPNYTNISETIVACDRAESRELLNRIRGNGLSATYRFTRSLSIFSPKMASVDLVFTNHSAGKMQGIKIGQHKLPAGLSMQEFPEITELSPSASTSVLMAIDFNDTTQPTQFTLCGRSEGDRELRQEVSITPPIGELLRPNTLTTNDFLAVQAKLTGMNQHTCRVSLPPGGVSEVQRRVLHHCNMLPVSTVAAEGGETPTCRFAAITLGSGVDVLVTLSDGSLTVNCEKLSVGSLLLKAVRLALEQ